RVPGERRRVTTRAPMELLSRDRKTLPSPEKIEQCVDARGMPPQALWQWSRLWLILFSIVLLIAFCVGHWGKRGFALSAFGDLSFLLIYWFYCYAMWVIPYRFVVPEDGIYSFHFNTIDTLGHIIFVAVLGVVALRARGAWRNLYRLYWASFALYTLSSMIANVAIDEGKYYSGSLYDLPLLTSVAGIASFAI